MSFKLGLVIDCSSAELLAGREDAIRRAPEAMPISIRNCRLLMLDDSRKS
jgi:hypothetical protein